MQPTIQLRLFLLNLILLQSFHSNNYFLNPIFFSFLITHITHISHITHHFLVGVSHQKNKSKTKKKVKKKPGFLIKKSDKHLINCFFDNGCNNTAMSSSSSSSINVQNKTKIHTANFLITHNRNSKKNKKKKRVYHLTLLGYITHAIRDQI